MALCIGYNYPNSFVGFSTSSSIDNGHVSLSSYNTQNFKKIRDLSETLKAKEQEKFIHYLKEGGIPQILCSQETGYAGFNLIKEELKYPNAFKDSEWGVAIYSKDKIIDKGEIDLKSDEASAAIWIDIQAGKDTIRVYNVHLKTNLISKTTAKMMEDPNLQSPKTWSSVRSILANYKNSTIQRSKQAKIIAKHMSLSPYKTILCGDFNDTPLSHVYRLLSKNKKDSFNESGLGIGTTYAGKIPALRIDYILADDRLDIIDHKIHKGTYSDHYSISAKIVLP